MGTKNSNVSTNEQRWIIRPSFWSHHNWRSDGCRMNMSQFVPSQIPTITFMRCFRWEPSPGHGRCQTKYRCVFYFGVNHNHMHTRKSERIAHLSSSFSLLGQWREKKNNNEPTSKNNNYSILPTACLFWILGRRQMCVYAYLGLRRERTLFQFLDLFSYCLLVYALVQQTKMKSHNWKEWMERKITAKWKLMICGNAGSLVILLFFFFSASFLFIYEQMNILFFMWDFM